MATHDYIISNASGAAVRADLNNALAAIATNNSSATEPTTTYAYQWWADTGSSPTVMKLRNAANSAWVTLFQLDGEWSVIPFENGTAAAPSIYFKDSGTDTGFFSPGVDQVGITTGGAVRLTTSTTAFTGTLPWQGQNGTAAAPALSFSGDPNTGVYNVGADNIGISTNGTLRFDVSTTATTSTLPIVHPLGAVGTPSVTFTGDLNTGFWSPAADTIAASTGGSERIRLDSSGRLLVGTSTASSGAPTGGALIQGTGSAAGPITLQIDATPAAAGTDVGLIRFTNSSGGLGAQIKCVSDGSWTNGSNHRSRLEFSTTPDGSSSPTERMRLDSAGSMVLASGTAFVAPYVHNTTTATAANVNVDATGFLRRSTSSIKYKTNIETIEDQYADAILNCRPVWYQSTCDADKPEWGYWGFIAEEVAEIDPRLCFFKEEEDGTLEPEGVQYDRFVPHLLNLIKRQGEAIADLQAEVAALKTQ